MGISYGKGRAIMSLMEQQLGYTIIESQQGGSTGGHSELTMEGRELMRKYSAFSTAATRSLQELFDIYFPDEE
jgi:molybdate transport repressor ModE-like protein